MTLKRRSLLYALLLVALLVAVLWHAWGTFAASRRAAGLAAIHLDEAQRLMQQIDLSRQGSRVAGQTEVGEGELVRRVEAAATTAGALPSQIVRIDPAPARRLGESPYKQKSTRLQLRAVTLSQAVEFLEALDRPQEEPHQGLTLSTVRLSAAREETNRGLWDLDATVNYLLYAPRSARAPQEDSS